MSVTYFAPKRKTLGPNSSICFTLATEKTTSAKLAISFRCKICYRHNVYHAYDAFRLSWFATKRTMVK